MVVVVPLASCEQHGRHLPVFTDTLQIEAIVDRLDTKLADEIVILPALWLGCSHHHLDFPGTLSLTPIKYTEVLQELVGCLLHHGFRRLFFLNGHGGNVIPASQALLDLIVKDDRADAGTLAFASWWKLGSTGLNPELHKMETPTLTHACEYESSLILAIANDLVKLGEISPEHLEKTRPWMANPRWAGKVEGFHRFHRWTSTGHMGEPAHATREKGEYILEAVTAELVDFFRDFAKWPKMEKLR